MLIRDKDYKYFDSFKVDPIDTTGAGDIFNAGLASTILNEPGLGM